MKNKKHSHMQPEYDFSKGIRGKYAAPFAAGTNLIALAPDVAKIFSDSDSVNEMLRVLLKLFKRSKKHVA